MKSTLTTTLLLSAIFSGYGQSRYPQVKDSYDGRLSSLGNLWAYVERVDHALDSANKTIDSLTKELRYQRILLQFNTDMSNYYIRKVDSLKTRIETLESRPSLFFHIDSSGRFFNNPINTFVTGTAVLDTAVKRKP